MIARGQGGSAGDYDKAAGIFRVLGDATRLKILGALSAGELRVQEITERLGMTQSAISHQLSILKASRIVKARRAGKWIYYSIDDDHVKGLFDECMEHVAHW